MTFKGRAKCIPKDPDAVFLPFQSKWIQDDSRIKLMEKSRQIGISWSTAYAADERAAAQGARFDEWVSSRDDIQARLFIEDCKLWAGVLGLGLGSIGLAFVVWDIGMKRGDVALLGVASYAAPVLSTLVLVLFGYAPASWLLGVCRSFRNSGKKE